MSDMTVGERIRAIRKEKGISTDVIAEALGVSVSTLYRYENSSIEKIPVNVFNRLCEVLEITPAELMGNKKSGEVDILPTGFKNAREAMEFMIKLPTLAAFGGYDPSKMDDKTIVQFANEILQQLKLVSYKYKEQ